MVVLLPIVLTGITAVVITSLQDDTGISTRLADSHDAQITSAYFVRDVQSARSITTQTSPSLCPTSGTATQLLGLYWTLGNVPVYVSYGFSSSSTSPVLVRRYCQGSTEVDSTVSHGLFGGLGAPSLSTSSCPAGVSSCATSGSATDATITVDCDSGAVTCADAGLITTYAYGSSPGIQSVALSVTESSTGYSFNLTASPREQLEGSEPPGSLPPGSTAPAVLLLGSGVGTLNCSGSGHSGPVIVNGIVAVNSSVDSSLVLGGTDSLTASEIYTEDPSSAAVSGTHSGTYVPGPAYPDPYASLPDPSTSGLTTYSAVAPATTITTVPGPGVYRSQVVLTSAQTFPPGEYIFEDGISMSGNRGTTFSGTGVFFFIGIPNAPPSTPQPATYTVSGNAVVDITAPTDAGDPYDGIVLFQSRNDSHTLTISGNGNNTTYGGVIYAPDAQVDTAGNGATFAGTIVSNSLTCGGNGGVSVGFAGVETTPSSTSIALGSANTDTVTILGNPNRGDPTGTVTFYECGPTSGAVPCTSKSNEVGSGPVNLAPGPGNSSSAISPSFTPASAGTWCFAGYYSGDPNYGASSDDSVNECFTVGMGPSVEIAFPGGSSTYTISSGGTSWSTLDPCTPAQAICGTAGEASTGVSITSVQISIQGPSGSCWDGTVPTSGTANFTAACANWLTVTTGAPNWSEAWNASYFTPGTYTVKVLVTDSSSATATARATFTVTS